ncbi:hypothetical protein Q7P37_005548 [Cladosporium fusiforme]
MASRAALISLQPWGCILTLLTVCSILALAQDCYYPNGDISPNDSPCSDDGGACCPLNWECLSNGLCYLENAHYFERHTCTDQNWDDPKCPHMCTYDYTAAGNEAILLCNPDDESSWCCDDNRASFNCCEKAGATTFSVSFGTQVAMISSEPSSKSSLSSRTITFKTFTVDDSSSASRSTSSTSDTTTSRSVSPTRSAPSTSTAIITTITSNSEGQVSTLISTTIITTAAAAADSPSASSTTPTSEPTKRRQLPVILGVSIGVPLGLIAGGILFYIFRRKQKHEASMTPSAPNTDVFFPPDATNLPTTYEKAELDSHSASVAEQKQHKHNIPTELEATSPSLNQPSTHPPSSVSPLTGSHDARWSAVSSLSPNPDQYTSNGTGAPPTALGLQAVGQQHYGSGQHYLYRPVSAPEGAGAIAPQYRPYRPPMGGEQQQAVELAGSDVPAVKKADDNEGSGGAQE